MPVFVGPYSQRGHGLGGILGSLGKMAMPLLKQVGKMAGRQALSTGANLLGDLFKGKNLKASLKTRGTEAIKNTGLNALRVAHQALSGRPRQTAGTTRRRKPPAKKRTTKARRGQAAGKATRGKKRKATFGDIFG
jgi:hypothetical protein